VEFGKLAKAHHPWLRITTQETPSVQYTIKAAASEPNRWPNTILVGPSPANIKKVVKDDPVKFKAGLDLKALFNYGTSGPIFFMTFDSSIKSPQHMVGKRIALGTKTQLFWSGSLESVLRSWGIYDKVKIDYLGPDGATNALLDGQANISAAAVFTGSPDAAPQLSKPIVDAQAKGKPIYFIGATEAEAKKAVAIDEGLTGEADRVNAEYLPGTILYPGGAKEIWGLVHFSSVYAHKNLPDEIAYELTKLALDHHKEMYPAHSLLKLMTPEFLPYKLQEVWSLHPGALRAYQDYAQANPNSNAAKLYKRWGLVK
jgi:TRAP-type uncharacterized transport system substrate-binding protein